MKTRGGFALAVLAVTSVGCHSSSSSSSPESPGDSGTHVPGDSGPAGSCSITPPTLSDWRLHADGTLFRDSAERVVFLRGVDAGGRSKFAPYVPFDFPDGGYATSLASYMDRAASWGINAMRVPFTWAALEPAQGQDDEGWLTMYDQFLDAAWARGIFTVVDFHQDVYSEVFCGDGFPAWTVPDAGPPAHDCPSWQLEYYNDPPMQAAFDAFWDASSPVQAAYLSAWDVMIARYKDKPGVLGFEPINEPGWGTENESTFDSTTLTAFYSMMVPRMRGEAPTSLVFVDPTGVDGSYVSTTLGKPSGDGIVFAPHYYPLAGAETESLPGLQTWANLGASWNVPTFLGEFGASALAGNTLAYIADIYTSLDTLGMSATEWEYSVESEEWNSETDSVVGPDGGEYPVVQAILRPFARAVAGSAITQSWNAATGTFTLSFTPTSGVTDVSLPARAYPTGYAVTIAGACFDASTPGHLWVQPDGTSKPVSVTVAPSSSPGDD
jgi:endoglycosylceramidase